MMPKVLNNLFCRKINLLPEDSTVEVSNKSIKLYKIRLLDFVPLVPRFELFLTTFEKDRARRYHFEKDRHRFIICRFLLKQLLAEETGLEVMDINLGYLQDKKPFLPSHPRLYFNLSHSSEIALIGISSRKVGVDLEKVDKDQDYFETIPTIFGPDEIDILNRANDKRMKFFEFWTRKEAIVKAIGSGITNDLKSISVTDGYHTLSKDILGSLEKLTTLSFQIDDYHIGSLSYEGDYHNSFEEMYLTNLQL